MTAALAVVAVVFLLAYGGLWLLEIAVRLIAAMVMVAIWLPLAVAGLVIIAANRVQKAATMR